jgi:hypothetical protein
MKDEGSLSLQFAKTLSAPVAATDPPLWEGREVAALPPGTADASRLTLGPRIFIYNTIIARP